MFLIDEADIFFGLDFYGNTFNPAALFANEHIMGILEFIWSNRESVTIDNVLGTNAFKQLVTLYPTWEKLFASEVSKMLYDLKHMDDYKAIVMNDKIGYKVHDEISFNVVHGYATVFTYFKYHAMGDISKESLEQNVGMYIGCGNLSYAEIPHLFKVIMGVSGTFESLTETEKETIAQYKIVRVATAPSIYGKSRQEFNRKKNVKAFDNKKDWFAEITQNAQFQIDHRRAVLIFLDSEEDVFEYEKQAVTSFQNLQTLTERTEDKENVVRRSTLSGTVTVCSRSFARGVDFICRDSQTRASGGVHVICAFVPVSIAELTQVKGRSARQGEEGSFALILLTPDLHHLEFDQKKVDKHIEQEDFFDVLIKAVTDHYNIQVQSLVEKAKSVLPQHQRTRAFHEALTSYTGSPQGDKDIQQFVMDLNATALSVSAPTSKFHIFLCLDDSGSMSGQPWNELLEAVKVFTDDQVSACMKSGVTPEHLVTIINHASSAEVMCDSIPIQNLDVNVHTRFRSGGNCFKTALNRAYNEMMKVLEGFTLVLLFMSDGGCSNGEHEIQLIARDFAGKNLQLFFVGFGAGCDERKLKNMAVISGGEYVFGANGVDLKQGFMKISEELTTKTYTR